MQPNADMVRKECGFSKSETASCLCTRVAWRFPCLPAMARDGELIQTQYFCHHADTICHTNSSYVTTKLYETSHMDVTICRDMILWIAVMLKRSIARKTASKWTVCVCQNCDPKTETIDRHTLSLALRKFATISVSFRTLHTPLSWMKSLTKQWK